MEFKTFVNAFLRLPCQIVSAGRRLIHRLLRKPWQRTFFRTTQCVADLKTMKPESGCSGPSRHRMARRPVSEVSMAGLTEKYPQGTRDSTCKVNHRENRNLRLFRLIGKPFSKILDNRVPGPGQIAAKSELASVSSLQSRSAKLATARI